MVDRASSSRAPQGDRLPNRSHQDSHHRSARDQHVTTWGQRLGRHNRQTDQQASTSSGWDNDTRDEWQKRFQVLLDDYRFCLNDILKESKVIQDSIIEEYKQEFGRANESKRKEYVKNLSSLVRDLQTEKFQDNEQIAIDEELGYFLKSKDEELKNIRKEALVFLKEKIENGIERKIRNKSDKRAEISKWTHALDEYCLFNHSQRVREAVYRSVADDMKLIYEHNLEEIENAKKSDLYKNDNEEIYLIIKKINLSLYSILDREALMGRERIEAAREWQNLANRAQESDNERNHSLSDSDHEGRRSTIISSDDEEIRNVSFEQLQMEQAIQQSLEQSNPRVNSHRDLGGPATVGGGGSLIRTQFWQVFERIHQIVWLYCLEHDHRPQIQEQRRLEQRNEVIDVSHMASPQIIDLGEVLRQQLQRMWRRMLRSDA